jgi:hypothetical protein
VDIGWLMLMGEEKASDHSMNTLTKILAATIGRKNKCGLGQPPGPHCCRERSDCRLSPGRKIIAQPRSEKRYASMLT